MTLREVLDEFYHKVPGLNFVIVMDLQEGLPLEFYGPKYQNYSENISAAFTQILNMVNQYKHTARQEIVREALRQFKEFILETSRSYFIIMPIGKGDSYGVAAGIDRQRGNLGFFKVMLNTYTKRILDSIK